MKLTIQALEVLKDPKIRAHITLATGKSDFTILKWIRENNEKLTMAAIVEVISKHSHLNKNEILSK